MIPSLARLSLDTDVKRAAQPDTNASKRSAVTQPDRKLKDGEDCFDNELGEMADIYAKFTGIKSPQIHPSDDERQTLDKMLALMETYDSFLLDIQQVKSENAQKFRDSHERAMKILQTVVKKGTPSAPQFDHCRDEVVDLVKLVEDVNMIDFPEFGYVDLLKWSLLGVDDGALVKIRKEIRESTTLKQRYCKRLKYVVTMRLSKQPPLAAVLGAAEDESVDLNELAKLAKEPEDEDNATAVEELNQSLDEVVYQTNQDAEKSKMDTLKMELDILHDAYVKWMTKANEKIADLDEASALVAIREAREALALRKELLTKLGENTQVAEDDLRENTQIAEDGLRQLDITAKTLRELLKSNGNYPVPA